MSRWEEAETLIAVIDAGGFAAAAQRLGVSQSTVSRRIATLEARLGGRQLLARTTRSVRTTELGERYAADARRAIAGLARAERDVRDEAGALRGELHLTLPPSLGRECLLPVLEPLLAAHPALRLKLDMTERYVDLHEELVDLAVRVRAVERSGIHDELLARAPFVIVGVPGYLDRFGRPGTPAELSALTLIAQLSPRGTAGIMDELRGLGVALDTATRIRTNDASTIKHFVLAGVGVSGFPLPLVRRELEAGMLEALDIGVPLPSSTYYASLPRDRLHSPSVRAVIDAFRAALLGEQRQYRTPTSISNLGLPSR